MAKLPDLHGNAKKIKNKKRLQHDGGRAWIKNPQLHDSIKGQSETFYSIDTDTDTDSENESKKEK